MAMALEVVAAAFACGDVILLTCLAQDLEAARQTSVGAAAASSGDGGEELDAVVVVAAASAGGADTLAVADVAGGGAVLALKTVAAASAGEDAALEAAVAGAAGTVDDGAVEAGGAVGELHCCTALRLQPYPSLAGEPAVPLEELEPRQQLPLQHVLLLLLRVERDALSPLLRDEASQLPLHTSYGVGRSKPYLEIADELVTGSEAMDLCCLR
ncbi:hypothetical protein FI667_g4665, partial [Globisporangium splendens]